MATTFKSFGQRIHSWFRARKLRPIRKQDKRCRPLLEVLEDRVQPSGTPAIGDVFYIDMENHNFTQPNGNVSTTSSTIEQIQGNPAAPYINSLITPGNPNAAMVSYATNYHNVMATPTGAPPTPNIHPSEPNYIWQEGGSNFGQINNDDDPYANNGNPDSTLNNNVKLIASTGFTPPTLSALLQAKYGTTGWHSYQEDMQYTGLSVPTSSTVGTNGTVNPYNGSTQFNYAVKHDGTLFYTATNGGTLTGPGPSDATNTEAAYYSPIAQLSTDLTNNKVARYNLITPDQYNDMHTPLTGGFTYNGTLYTGDAANIAQGDNFLSKIIPLIEASAAFKNNGEIVIWNDETEAQNSSDTTQNDFNHTSMEIVISPLAKGNAYASTLNYTHSSDLKTLEEIFGVTAPGGALLGDANTPATNGLSDLYRSTSATAGTFNPATATWYLRNENSPGAPDAGQFQYGGPNWTPVVGDWNGDGLTTVGVVNPSNATWYLRNENSSGAPDAAAPFSYGLSGWTPVAGNWNGGQTSGIGMFDPTSGTWYLRNETSPGAPDAGKFQYGGPGWIPVVGNWTGTGTTTTIGVVDPSTMTWYLRSSNTPGAPTITPFQYGAPGWIPVVGDWNNDGTTSIGVVDPTTGTWYLRNENSAGAPDAGKFQYGGSQWNYLAGQWQSTTNGTTGLAEFAAGGALAADPSVPALTNAQLQQTVSAALTRLEAAGIGQALLARLEATNYVVGQLPQGLLGYTYTQQNTVVVSPTAAGYGWFVDSTPQSDAAFTPDATGALTAPPGSPAAGRMDLMTVVLHEMGHVAGYSDVSTQSHPNNLMDATLGIGVRRTADLDVLFANGVG